MSDELSLSFRIGAELRRTGSMGNRFFKSHSNTNYVLSISIGFAKGSISVIGRPKAILGYTLA